MSLRNWESNYLTAGITWKMRCSLGIAAILTMVLYTDGKRCERLDSDNTVKDWDLETRTETSSATFGGTVTDVVLAANGRILHSNVAYQTSSSSFTMGSQFLDFDEERM